MSRAAIYVWIVIIAIAAVAATLHRKGVFRYLVCINAWDRTEGGVFPCDVMSATSLTHLDQGASDNAGTFDNGYMRFTLPFDDPGVYALGQSRTGIRCNGVMLSLYAPSPWIEHYQLHRDLFDRNSLGLSSQWDAAIVRASQQAQTNPIEWWRTVAVSGDLSRRDFVNEGSAALDKCECHVIARRIGVHLLNDKKTSIIEAGATTAFLFTNDGESVIWVFYQQSGIWQLGSATGREQQVKEVVAALIKSGAVYDHKISERSTAEQDAQIKGVLNDWVGDQ